MTQSKAFVLASLALGLVASALLAGGPPATDPLDITFTSGNFSNDVPGGYSNGIDGVLAHFPGTGNIVLDPDAKKNATRRSIVLDLQGGNGPLHGTKNAYFMSINAVGKDCLGRDFSTAPRDLDLNECIQADVAVNDIEGSGYLLRCGTNKYNPNDPDRTDLDNVHVTCVDDDGTRCTEWSIAPGGTSVGGDPTLRCALFTLPKNKLIRVHSVPYEMPFTAEVVRQ